MMKLSFLFLFLVIAEGLVAQPFDLKVALKNQPYNSVVIGRVEGDRLLPADTLITRNSFTREGPLKSVAWTFPADAPVGMYRLVLGQTTYAQVMDEPPQQFDFIYNRENIQLETDFKAPSDSLQVLLSEENRLWFSFLKMEKEYRQKVEELDREVAYYQEKISGQDSQAASETVAELEVKTASLANALNQLQMEWDMNLVKMADEHPELLVARLIQAFREPIRDGYLTEAERKQTYQENYFRYVDFSDEILLHSTILTDKIFNYLVTYNQKDFSQQQREEAYIKAVDDLMRVVEKSEDRGGTMHAFVLEYLVNGFKGLQMEKVLNHLEGRYGASLK